MNNQQELINAINSISNSRNKSYDTPATVLRVEGDTVWVHIDGGADETPVQKTINCAQGETVQVRISNGSAFLVGNASAPPTDDKVANVAHFVAVEADEKATAAVRSVDAISQTVEGKVDVGDSNIEVLSSTMYQNANGVNIFNGNLAVGDSYAHIDGDSFDIKEVTTAGTIDDTNDDVLASFGASNIIIGSDKTVGDYYLKISNSDFRLLKVDNTTDEGWIIENDQIRYTGFLTQNVSIRPYRIQMYDSGSLASQSIIEKGYANFKYEEMGEGKNNIFITTDYDACKIECEHWSYPVPPIGGEPRPSVLLNEVIIDGYNGNVQLSNELQDLDGNNLLDEWTSTANVDSNSTVTFTGLNDDYAYDLYCEDKLINISSITKTGSGSNVTLVYTVSGAASGDVCKLRILK